MPTGDKQAALRPPPGPGAAPGPPCPECGTPVADVESHLRLAHQVYEFRGARRSYNDTVAHLLGLLVGGRHDPEAWETLAAMAHEDHGGRADYFLASLLSQSLARLDEKRRAAVAESLGQLLAAAGAVHLAAVLAADAEIAARHLALAVLAQLPPPLPPVLVAPLRGLLLDRRLPPEQQLAAAAVLVRGADAASPLLADILETLITGVGPARAVERLRRLEHLVGPTAAIDALCGQLEDRARMTCPRCGAERPRPEMVVHLWEAHRLVLDGRRVRDPWAVVEEWIDAYKARRDATLLERCRVAAGRIDPAGGLARLQRLLLSHGIDDPDARHALLEQARQAHITLCPSCFAPVPLPPQDPPYLINLYRGRLSAHGYRVEICEGRLQTVVEVETPAGLVSRGPESGRRRLSSRAVATAAASPLVLLAGAVATGAIGAGFSPFWPVLLLLGGAAAAHRYVRRRWSGPMPLEDRVRGHAWDLLAPRLNQEQFNLVDSAFLAGLAHNSLGRGPFGRRAGVVAEQLLRTEAAVARGEAPASHLAELCRLQAEDAARGGADPVPLVAAHLAGCFAGRLPLEFAQYLLRDWDSDWWTRGNRARLRILLCDCAFEAGLEVCTLRAAGRSAPALGQLLETSRPDALAALRLLRAMRRRRPWDACGACRTAFEVAADPQQVRLLGRYPDLLLFQEERGWPLLATGTGEAEPVRILLCARGVVLQEVPFTAAPVLVDQVNRPGATDISFEDHRFHLRGRFDAIGPRMKQWFALAFEQLLPRVADVATWEPADRAMHLRATGAVPCPACGNYLVPRPGDVGAAVDDKPAGD
jgi:hypothetical protein